jgi:hypothetical protein
MTIGSALVVEGVNTTMSNTVHKLVKNLDMISPLWLVLVKYVAFVAVASCITAGKRPLKYCSWSYD